MASSIDKNAHNPLAQQNSAQTQTPAPAKKAASASKPVPTQHDVPEEWAGLASRAAAPKATVSQPMLGAFAKSPSKAAAPGHAPSGTGSLMEQQNVLAAASNIMSKTQAASGLAKKAAGGAGMSALGVSLAVPFLAIPAALGAVAVASGASLLARRSARQAVRADSDLQGDVDVLKAARDRISKLENPSQVEKATLNAAEKGLAGVKS